MWVSGGLFVVDDDEVRYNTYHFAVPSIDMVARVARDLALRIRREEENTNLFSRHSDPLVNFGSNSSLPKVLGQYGGDAEVRQPSAGTCRYGRVEGGREGRGRDLEGEGVVLSNKVEDNN